MDKYKTEEEKTLTRKISKLNMHSIGKKSSRIGQRFLSSIGIDTSIKDCDFDDLEKRYSYLTRIIQMFASDSQNFKKQFHDTVICQFNVAQNVADLYRERVHTREVERFRVAHQNILATHWNEFVSVLRIFGTKYVFGAKIEIEISLVFGHFWRENSNYNKCHFCREKLNSNNYA